MSKKESVSILIVDDEEEILKAIENYLSFFDNLNIYTATSFEESLQLIQKVTPRVAIIDINLPDGNGLKLIKKIRMSSKANQAIIMTGMSDLSRVLKALDSGAVDYLRKPLDMVELRTVINEAVKRFLRWKKVASDELSSKQK